VASIPLVDLSEPQAAVFNLSRCASFRNAKSALSEGGLSNALCHLGRFDAAIGHGEAAVRIAEENDHPFTLFIGLLFLGWVHLDRGDFPRAARVLERTPTRPHVAVR
jgi:hypothetical protein